MQSDAGATPRARGAAAGRGARGAGEGGPARVGRRRWPAGPEPGQCYRCHRAMRYRRHRAMRHRGRHGHPASGGRWGGDLRDAHACLCGEAVAEVGSGGVARAVRVIALFHDLRARGAGRGVGSLRGAGRAGCGRRPGSRAPARRRFQAPDPPQRVALQTGARPPGSAADGAAAGRRGGGAGRRCGGAAGTRAATRQLGSKSVPSRRITCRGAGASGRGLSRGGAKRAQRPPRGQPASRARPGRAGSGARGRSRAFSDVAAGGGRVPR